MGFPKRIDQLDPPARALQLTDIAPFRDPNPANGPAHKYTVQNVKDLIGVGGGFTIANNGVSSTGGTTVQLGTANAGNGAPFAAQRFIDMNGFALRLKSAKMIWDDAQDITQLYTYSIATPTIERAFTNSTDNLMPHERRLDANPNGGPPDDLIYMQGWNIDCQYNAGNPSFTTRMEYMYTGSLYEYHLQWQNNSSGSRLYRLLSFTMQDHAGVGDLCDIFAMGTFAMRALGQSVDYFAVSGGQATGTTGSSFLSQAGGLIEVRKILFDDNVTPSYTIEQHTGAPAPFFFNNFSKYLFNGSLQIEAVAAQTPLVGTPTGSLTPFYIYGQDVGILGDGDIMRLSFYGGIGALRGYVQMDQGTGDFKFFSGYKATFYTNFTLALTLDNTQNAQFAGSIQTVQPSANGAGVMKFGKVRAGAVVLDSANYVETMIDGVIKKVLIAA